MSLLSKIILGFVAVTAIALLVMSSITLKIWSVAREGYNRNEAALAVAQQNVAYYVDGDPERGAKSISELREEYARVVAARGRAWFGVEPKRVDQQTGVVGVRTGLPNPPEIDDRTVLYVFEQIPEGTSGVGIPPRRYLGEFRVTGVAPPDPTNPDAANISLEPTSQLQAAELNRLAQSTGPWAMYETMPQDTDDAFAGLDEAQLRELMPDPENDPASQFGEPQLSDIVSQSRNEYLRNGQEPQPDDAPERVGVTVRFTKNFSELDPAAAQALQELHVPGGLVVKDSTNTFQVDAAMQLIQLEVAEEVSRQYQRTLNDYNLIFREFTRQIPHLRNEVASLRFHLDLVTKNLEATRKYEMEREEEKQKLTAELGRLNEELEVVTTYENELSEKLTAFQQAIAELEQENDRLAAQLAEVQFAGLQRSAEPAPQQTVSTARP